MVDMAEIGLSIMTRETGAARELIAQAWRALLDEFEARNRIRVHLHLLEWNTAWTEVLKIALYQHGPDVSEIGTTWLGSVAGMNALEPFLDDELAATEWTSFLPSIWQSGELALSPQAPPMRWAIPWWADTRILYYRRDLLGQAHIDEAAAFDSFEHLKQTLGRLQEAAVAVPWVIPTHRARMTIHNVVSWVWGAGGCLISDDGRHVLFHRAGARAGIRAYFALAPYVAEPARNLDDAESEHLFAEGHAAATISGPWLKQQVSPEVAGQLGMTVPPGIPFVGGSHLVRWKHSKHRQAAVKLIHFLTDQRVQSTFGQRAGLLPARLDVLANPPFADDPFYQVVTTGLKRGRSIPAHRLWGLVEDKLNESFGRVWSVVLSQPELDLEQILADHLDPMAHQLDIALSSRR
jgi:multiple sugar transport system substrate-binding protein